MATGTVFITYRNIYYTYKNSDRKILTILLFITLTLSDIKWDKYHRLLTLISLFIYNTLKC